MPSVSKPLAQWLTRPITFFIGGREWPLVFTYRVLLTCQDLTGTDMLRTNMAVPSATMLRALLFSCLSVAGAPCSIDAVGKRITFASLPRIQRTMLAAWCASFPEPKKGAVQDDPDSAASGRQSLTWLDLWAGARENHGLSDDEWLDMTPRQFGALQAVRMIQLQREEILVGILAATTQNFSARCPDGKQVSAESFMLNKLPEPEPVVVDGEYIMAAMKRSRAGRR